MVTQTKFPKEFRVPVSQDHLRTIKAPNAEHLSIIHAFVKIKDFQTGELPDKINPRSHEKLKMKSRIPKAILETLEETPELFHLLNRGCLILAHKAWYDNKTKILHFIIKSQDEHGMVDGATTDRVLMHAKQEVSCADFEALQEDEIPAHLKESYIHLEIIAGRVDDDLRIKLADARNTSEQVKEFSLEDLGHGFDWLKDVIEDSEFQGKIRYRENEPKPVDIRTVLAFLTLFHPKWDEDEREPLIAYTAKGTVIDYYRKDEWRGRYEILSPVVTEILRLYEHIYVKFQPQYMKAFGKHSKLGKRKEVRYIDPGKNPRKKRPPKKLPLTGQKTRYVIPDGWMYPLLAAFRALLCWRGGKKQQVFWKTDPFKYFDAHGSELIADVVSQSEQLGNNPNATGKSRVLWSSLRIKVENRMFRRAAKA